MGEQRDQNRFLVRMPEGMRDRISEAAKANGRSMNSEIVARIEASFETMPPPLTPEIFDRIFGGFTQRLESIEKKLDNKSKP